MLWSSFVRRLDLFFDFFHTFEYLILFFFFIFQSIDEFGYFFLTPEGTYKTSGQNTSRQRDKSDPSKRQEYAQESPEKRHRIDISIADSGESHDGPPYTIKNIVDIFIDPMFDTIKKHTREEYTLYRNDKNHHELKPYLTRHIANQLEYAWRPIEVKHIEECRESEYSQDHSVCIVEVMCEYHTQKRRYHDNINDS